MAFGPFRLDMRHRILERDGRVVPLTPKAVDTLILLVENAGQVVDKETIMQRLWPDTFVVESTLDAEHQRASQGTRLPRSVHRDILQARLSVYRTGGTLFGSVRS